MFYLYNHSDNHWNQADTPSVGNHYTLLELDDEDAMRAHAWETECEAADNSPGLLNGDCKIGNDKKIYIKKGGRWTLCKNQLKKKIILKTNSKNQSKFYKIKFDIYLNNFYEITKKYPLFVIPRTNKIIRNKYHFTLLGTPESFTRFEKKVIDFY